MMAGKLTSKSVVIALGGCLCVLPLASCGESTATPTAGPTTAGSMAPTEAAKAQLGKKWERTIPTNPFADPGSPGRVIYSGDLASEPLPKPLVPVISRRAAIAISESDDGAFGSHLQPGTPRANLRLVTVGYPYDSRRLMPKPTWILTWVDSQPQVHGPVHLTGEERREIAPQLQCVFVEAVDAGTGEILHAMQACEKKQ